MNAYQMTGAILGAQGTLYHELNLYFYKRKLHNKHRWSSTQHIRHHYLVERPSYFLRIHRAN